MKNNCQIYLKRGSGLRRVVQEKGSQESRSRSIHYTELRARNKERKGSAHQSNDKRKTSWNDKY